MPARRGDRQLSFGVDGPLLAIGVQSSAHGEPLIRLVAPDPDHDLTADTVRAADAADYIERILLTYQAHRTEGQTFASWVREADEALLK